MEQGLSADIYHNSKHHTLENSIVLLPLLEMLVLVINDGTGPESRYLITAVKTTAVSQEREQQQNEC